MPRKIRDDKEWTVSVSISMPRKLIQEIDQELQQMGLGEKGNRSSYLRQIIERRKDLMESKVIE